MRALILIGLMIVFSAPASAAATSCGNEGVAVQVLGSGNGDFSARRAGNSMLVWVDGRARVLINAGGGSALRFHESGAAWNDLDAILFTQIDTGHSTDLPALLNSVQHLGRTRALPVYGPSDNRQAPSTVMFVRDLLDPVRGIYRHLGGMLAPLEKRGYKLEPHDVREPTKRLTTPRRPGAALLPVFANDRLRVHALLHAPDPALRISWRLDIGNVRLAVASGAQDDHETLARLTHDAALLVAPFPVTNASSSEPFTGLGQGAHQARVRQIVFMQRGPSAADRTDEALAALRRGFAGPVHFADDLRCYLP